MILCPLTESESILAFNLSTGVVFFTLPETLGFYINLGYFLT